MQNIYSETNRNIYINKNRNKTRFIFLSIKRNVIPAVFCIFTVCLVLFSKSNLSACKAGLLLWANSVVPSLLPFFIATELLSYTNVIYIIGKLLNPIMRPIFNIPGEGSFAFLMGIISGYPTGAKIVTNLREQEICTKEEAERMLSFTNNSGPLFIIGTVGITFFGNSLVGLLLLITHILAGITVGIIFRFWKINSSQSSKVSPYLKNIIQNRKEVVSFNNLGDVLGKSILSAVKTVIMIGGFIVLFSVIISILKNTNLLNLVSQFFYPIFKMFGITDFKFCSSFISGIVELTNGVMAISNIACKQISINIILSAFLLGFGGFSVLLQVNSIIAKSDISIKPYFYGKLLHSIIAAFYTFLFITYLPMFGFNL